MTHPQITLYTNPNCPWAQRAHIALKELNLTYEEIFIDVEKPREGWYLAINPKGQVPTLSYNGTIIAESGIIAQFLADAHPAVETEMGIKAGLLLPSDSFDGAIQRARVSFFVDAWVSKVYPTLVGIIMNGESHETSTEGLVEVIEKEVELLLVSTSGDGGERFFGGSETLTLAEVLVGPFLLWIFTLVKTEYGVLSGNLVSVLRERAPRFASWGVRVFAHESVRHVLDEEWVGKSLKGRWEAAVAKKKSEEERE
ncbi:putative glutathione S-transferase [Aspergillus carlsbadensis]|nr:putative glutathione S-transferase [Aspergillus carlsbadensis]